MIKQLHEAAKLKSGQEIKYWIDHIQRHFRFCLEYTDDPEYRWELFISVYFRDKDLQILCFTVQMRILFRHCLILLGITKNVCIKHFLMILMSDTYKLAPKHSKN